MLKVCSSCGSTMEEDCKYCPNCGKPQDEKKPTKKKKEEQEKIDNDNVEKKEELHETGASTYGKSRIAAGLFGIFLGGFGVHNFYLGYYGKATAQLLLTVLSCCMLSFVSSIWGLIEGILILSGSINTDAGGNPLSD